MIVSTQKRPLVMCEWEEGIEREKGMERELPCEVHHARGYPNPVEEDARSIREHPAIEKRDIAKLNISALDRRGRRMRREGKGERGEGRAKRREEREMQT